MQTFLPFADFAESARVLDRARLQKQLVETFQLMKSLCDPSYGWKWHPAKLMWVGHANVLNNYQSVCAAEWRLRGYETELDHCTAFEWFKSNLDFQNERPSWLGREEFHASHRSNLLRKAPEHYSQFGWAEPNDLPYLWPVRSVKKELVYS